MNKIIANQEVMLKQMAEIKEMLVRIEQFLTAHEQEGLSKDKILAEIKELAKLHGELPFIRIDRIEQILTANEQKTDNEIAIKEIDRYIDNRDCPMPTEAIVHFELCKDWLQQEQECQ